MVRRIDLHETPERRLARMLRNQAEDLAAVSTGPTGVKHMGRDGDLVWTGNEWIINPNDPAGPLIPGPSYVTWSIRDTPKITETLTRDLDAAEETIEDARRDLAGIQEDLAGLDLAGIEEQLDQAVAAANGKNSRIISLNPASGTVNPETGLPLAAGDSWWQWDNVTDRNVIAAWVWLDGWQTSTLADSVLGSLDVNKLLVLGEARMVEAVVVKIMGDAAYFNAIKVEDLTVTGGAVINELVAAKMAAAMIITQVLRTEVDEVTGLYAILDSYGLRVIDNDGGPEGGPLTLIQLGPSGTNLLQLGDPDTGTATIDSAGGVTGVTGSFEDLYVGGRRVGVDTHTRPRGEIASAVLFGGYSRRLNGRGVVLGIDTMLDPGRLYLLQTNAPTVENEKPECEPLLELQVTLDGSAPESDWFNNREGESSIGWFPQWRNMPGMHYWVDLRDRVGPQIRIRAAVSLGNRANNGWCMVAAPVQPLTMTIEDRGTESVNRGYPFFDAGGGNQHVPKTLYTVRRHPTGWATYIRNGSRDYTPKPTQGMWSEWDRSCYFFFDDLTGLLAGAEVRRITLFSWADHWGLASGIGRWHRHGMYGSIPESGQTSTFMVDTPDWRPGSARTIDIIPEEFGLWQSGVARGFGFTSWETGHQFYGQFSPLLDAHFIEIEYLR